MTGKLVLVSKTFFKFICKGAYLMCIGNKFVSTLSKRDRMIDSLKQKTF